LGGCLPSTEALQILIALSFERPAAVSRFTHRSILRSCAFVVPP
jgi:hypothetical protein